MFVPGQLVICVRTPGNPQGEVVPRKGTVYTIREAYRYPDRRVGVRLREIVNEPRRYRQGTHEGRFLADCFRPLDDTKLDVFRAVLTDAPKDRETVE